MADRSDNRVVELRARRKAHQEVVDACEAELEAIDAMDEAYQALRAAEASLERIQQQKQFTVVQPE
jgi:hypothetical protein